MISDLEHDLEEVLVFTFADFVLKKILCKRDKHSLPLITH